MARQALIIANPAAVYPSDISELDPRKAQILRMWIPATQLFILLHEVAHIVLGHQLNDAKDMAERVAMTLANELEADAWTLAKILSLGPTLFGDNPLWYGGAS